MAQVGMLAGMVTRTWSVHGGGLAGKVELNHNTLTGWHALALDGVDVPGTEGSCHAMSSQAALCFDVGGRAGRVTIVPSMGSFSYECRFSDGEIVPEDNNRAPSSGGAEAPDLQVSVPSAVAGLDGDGKRVVYYRVAVRRASSGRENSVHRRFRDILSAFEAIQSAYKGTAAAASLPRAPSRSASWFVDHFAPEFVERRRAELDSFLRSLSMAPRAGDNGDLLGLLGLSSGNVRETSVLVSAGPLGLDLGEKGSNTAVRGFTRVGTEAGAAEASGRVMVGDLVSKVNGLDVVGEPHSVLLSRLRAAGRPVVVHFVGFFGGKGAAAEAGAGAAAAGAGAPKPAAAAAAAAAAPAPVSYAAAAGGGRAAAAAPAPAAAAPMFGGSAGGYGGGGDDDDPFGAAVGGSGGGGGFDDSEDIALG